MGDAIPKRKITVDIIDEALESNQEDAHRPHLGGSLVGHKCARHIWYSFRWYKKERFNGRMLRLFDRGHLEEERFGGFLKSAGFDIENVKPEKQLRYSMLGGHFSCEVDGFVKGLPEAPEKQHVLEFKTYSHDSFLKLTNLNNARYKQLKNDGGFLCDTKLQKKQHYTQMQVGMGMSGVDRALYLAVNKNDDNLAQERVRFSQKFFDSIVERAESIIFNEQLPPRISERPSWFECKFCKFKDICHNDETPEKNCRTCKYSYATQDGNWFCSKHQDNIPLEEQRKEHTCHAYA